MVENGFVKLPRNITQKSWFKEQNTLQLYIVLLLNAAFKDIERDGYTIRAGQYVTSRSKLMEMTRLTERQTKTAIAHLKASGDISVESNTKFSIITLNNYQCQPSDVRREVQPDDPQDVRQNVCRSISDKKRIKEERNKEETASPHSPAVLNDFSACDPAKTCSGHGAVCKQSLVEMYGCETVELYENKFKAWASAKNAVNVPMYPTIAKWLAQDKVPKTSAQSSSGKQHIDTERLRNAVMAQYYAEAAQPKA
ncbi:MAG: hypothetical protein K2J80_10725 [Oscillospiraceae bacterium]|nr:hypothetical protein [Oscillospiraceae bacterium]